MFVLRGELFLTYHGSAGSPSVPGTNAGRCHPTNYETSRLRLVIKDDNAEEKLAATLNGGNKPRHRIGRVKKFFETQEYLNGFH
jgi:hypothetical protein